MGRNRGIDQGLRVHPIGKFLAALKEWVKEVDFSASGVLAITFGMGSEVAVSGRDVVVQPCCASHGVRREDGVELVGPTHHDTEQRPYKSLDGPSHKAVLVFGTTPEKLLCWRLGSRSACKW